MKTKDAIHDQELISRLERIEGVSTKINEDKFCNSLLIFVDEELTGFIYEDYDLSLPKHSNKNKEISTVVEDIHYKRYHENEDEFQEWLDEATKNGFFS